MVIFQYQMKRKHLKEIVMKILGIMFCVIFLLMFIFCKIKINGSTDITIIQRASACLITSLLLTVILGLPILGIIYLLGF
jgi:hypothetical protein